MDLLFNEISGWVIVAIIILVILIIWVVWRFAIAEHFTNSENRKVYNMFRGVMENNGTLYDFKRALNKNKIRFSENENFGKEAISFNQYVELLKKYNKNRLNIDLIDKIRSQSY